MWKGCLAASAVLVGACSGNEQDCPPMSSLPLLVLVIDADTAESLCDVRVTASSAYRSQILVPTTQCSFMGGWGPGIYDITAEKDGYEPATEAGVVVREFGGNARAGKR
jgi:hypothetical protein